MQANANTPTAPPVEPPGGRRKTDLPTRSQIAPVGDRAPVKRDAGSDAPGTIPDLLKGLGSKTAAAALTGAVTLEKLPAAQRVALKQALLAASEAHIEVETIKVELTKVKDRLQLAEKDLLEKSHALRQQTVQAEVQVANLTEDLAAALVTGKDLESRFRVRTAYVWIAFGTALAAVTVCAFLLFHSWRPPPSPALPAATASRVFPHSVPEGAVRAASGQAVPQQSGPKQATEAAFDRLDQALAGVPFSEIDNALSEANLWLKASGAPPCSVRFDGAKVALLVTPASKGDGPLAESLGRCAQAVEHVVAHIVE